MSKHVAVLMGGWSAEREVSLRSGKACADALEAAGLPRHPRRRRPRHRDRAAARSSPTSRSTCCTAGPARTARCRASWKSSAFPTRHSGVLASALAMQKDVAKVVMKAAGVPVPEGMVVSRRGGREGASSAAALRHQADRRRARASASSSSPSSTRIRRRN